MKVSLYINHKPRYRGIIVKYPDVNTLIESISKRYKIFGNTNKERIEFIKNNYKNINLTILNFEYANSQLIRTIEQLKHNIKYLNLVTNNPPRSKIILTFLRKYNAKIIINNKTININNITYLESIILSIALLILLYLYWYMFAMAIVILLFYITTKNVIKNN